MYISTIIPSLLVLAAGSIASPLAPSEAPKLSESATVVDVASSSYSSLIVYNPAAEPTTTTRPGPDEFLTPSGVSVPQPSATLSFQGDVPSVSAPSVSSSSSSARESGGVRVVGQDGASSQAANDEDVESGDKENSARSAVGAGMGVGLLIGLGGVMVAAIGGAGLM